MQDTRLKNRQITINTLCLRPFEKSDTWWILPILPQLSDITKKKQLVFWLCSNTVYLYLERQIIENQICDDGIFAHLTVHQSHSISILIPYEIYFTVHRQPYSYIATQPMLEMFGTRLLTFYRFQPQNLWIIYSVIFFRTLFPLYFSNSTNISSKLSCFDGILELY